MSLAIPEFADRPCAVNADTILHVVPLGKTIVIDKIEKLYLQPEYNPGNIGIWADLQRGSRLWNHDLFNLQKTE